MPLRLPFAIFEPRKAMSNDITITFDDIIKRYRTLDLSEDIFRSMMAEDKQLVADYKEWCDTLGIPERKGFAYYYEEYIEQQGSIWDSLDDHDE